MSQLEGKCLCGAVEVRATPREQKLGACHCGMCRRWSGGPLTTVACGADVDVKGDALRVYRSSDWAERLFCSECGTVIAWRLQSGGEHHVSAQLFEGTGDYPLSVQVFIDDKPNNYSFAEQTKTMTGAQVFAMFAPPETS